MNSSSAIYPYTYAYQNVKGIAEYVNFEYELNWITVIVFVTFVYSTPCAIVFGKIAIFYVKNKGSISKSGLRVEMFQSFFFMQLWNLISVLSDYLMYRLPSTTLLTSFCTSNNPQFIMRISAFLYNWSSVTSQFLTVCFCILRVILLFFPMKHFETPTLIAAVLVPLVVALTALPHLLTEGHCYQLYKPYPFGSIAYASQFYENNLMSLVLSYIIFTMCTTLMIFILSVIMLVKMKAAKKKLTFQSRNLSKMKAEKTLTGTMIILLVPLAVHQVALLCQMFDFGLFCYVVLFRSFFVDMRVHVVTVYFYMTHPMFRKTSIVSQSTTSHTNLR